MILCKQNSKISKKESCGLEMFGKYKEMLLMKKLKLLMLLSKTNDSLFVVIINQNKIKYIHENCLKQ